jgi:hypothetical protein
LNVDGSNDPLLDPPLDATGAWEESGGVEAPAAALACGRGTPARNNFEKRKTIFGPCLSLGKRSLTKQRLSD